MDSQRATLTESEFCKAVNISRTLAWQLRKHGFPHLQVRSKILYTPEHIKLFVERYARSAGEFQEPKAA